MFIIFLYPTKQFKDKIDNEKEKKNREPNNFVVENLKILWLRIAQAHEKVNQSWLDYEKIEMHVF